MTEPFTYDQVMASARRVVASLPEGWCYDDVAELRGLGPGECLYQHDGAPVCLVGYVLHDLGIPLTERMEGKDPFRLASNGLMIAERGAVYALSEMQREQDSEWGVPWSEVVEMVALMDHEEEDDS